MQTVGFSPSQFASNLSSNLLCIACHQDLKPEDYTYHLSESDLAEIIAGTDAILARGVKDEEDIKKVSRVQQQVVALLTYCLNIMFCFLRSKLE